MTDDLLARLRVFHEYDADKSSFIREVADRIEKLEAALRFYAEPWKHVDQIPDFYSELDFAETARAALEGKDD